MRIDLTCPVELWQFTRPTQDEPECLFAFNNLSEKTVVSLQVTMVCHDQEGELLFRQIERVQGLKAGAGERFSIMLLPTQWEGVVGVELVVEKVWFDDAMIWRRGNAPLVEYQPNALPPGRQLDQLRFVAGMDAAGYPAEQEHVWVCVCGRANARSSSRCCRCGRRGEAVFASYQKPNVDRLIAVHEQKLRNIAKKAREDTGKLAEERERERERKRMLRRRRLRWGMAAVCLTAGAAAAVVWGLPELRYRRADAFLTEGKYGEARAAFAELTEYKDAASLVTRCDYLEAKAWLEAGGAENHQWAADAFLALGDYEDSPELRRQAVYRMGEDALAEGELETAMERFASLDDYRDSPARIMGIRYMQAQALLEDQAYEEAHAAFQALGAYEDAAERALSCQYLLGASYEAAEEYEQAIGRFAAAGAYEDAPERLRGCQYQLAEQKLAEGDREAAGRLYLQAGDYQDALMKANDSLYQLAQERFRAGDYGKAGELFEEIGTYLDSETMAWECVYQQAEGAMAAGDYAAAAQGFAAVPLHKDAADKVMESQYLQAGACIAEKRLEEAETLLEGLAGYKDSNRLLRQTRFQLGEKAAAEGDYQRAVELFEELGSYSNSAAKLRDSRYQLARNALIDHQYEAAIEGFSTLGNYEDSASLLADATYAFAMERKEAGDTEKAMALLETLPESAEARAELVELTLTEARKKKDAGDEEGAEAMLLAFSDEAEAMALYHTWQYAKALEQKFAGQYAEAARLFADLGEYQDAAEQKEECEGLYYGVVAEPARTAAQQKDYLSVIETLDGFPMTDLPRAYRDLPELYEQACYTYAEQLYNEGKPYEALPYYQRIPESREARQRLERKCYLLLGKWQGTDGGEAEFRSDGSCTILGEEFFFNVDNYAFYTGADRDSLKLTHRLTNVTKSALTLRDTRDGGNRVYKFTRLEEAGLSLDAPQPLATPTPASRPAQDMVVREDDHATPRP